MIDPAFGYLIVLSVALLLASAGSHKLRALSDFTEVFAAYRVLPDALSRRLAWLVPVLELATAAGLAWVATRRAALAAAILLLTGYAAAMAWNLHRGRRELDCGCGGFGERRSIAGWMVWRNVLLALALAGAALPAAPRALGAADALTIAGGVAASVLLYLAVEHLNGQVLPKANRLKRGSA